MPSQANVVPSRTRTWLSLSIAAVLMAIAGNVIGLSVKSIYSTLTPAFFPQAIAQDIASLVVVSPLWLILAILALRGSLRSYLLWLGVLVFTVYNYVIYTFSVPFGPLFPVWVATLGLSLYALIGGITSADPGATAATYTSRRAAKITAWFLIVAAILFAFLWLSEDVPALLAGTRPQSVIDMALPTNPVHILDLSFFLPGVVMLGIMLLKEKPLGFVLAPAAIVFLILTGIPILITPFVQSATGEAAGWGVVAPIGTLTAVSTGLLIWLMGTVRTASS
ncbi:MAG TPA: hypothetical protein VF784_09200 [Anaerolineales bacterium]